MLTYAGHCMLSLSLFLCVRVSMLQDRDLDCKLEEVREAGQNLPETQITDWLIQLLLGLHYMHDRFTPHHHAYLAPPPITITCLLQYKLG